MSDVKKNDTLIIGQARAKPSFKSNYHIKINYEIKGSGKTLNDKTTVGLDQGSI